VLPLIGLTWLCDAFARAESPPALLWSQQIRTPGADTVGGLTLDRAGNVYVAGETAGVLGNASLGQNDIYVRKYSPTGAVVWTTQYGTAAYEGANCLTLDATGAGLLVAGQTGGNLAGSNLGPSDAFFSQLDLNGNVLRTVQFGTAAIDDVSAVAAHPAGGAYLAGYTLGTLGASSLGSSDAFVRRFDPAMNVLWTAQFGSTGYDFATAVATDATGSVYVAGSTDGSVDAPGAGAYDGFLRKYSQTGQLLWGKQFGTAASDEAAGVALDGLGGVYVAGQTAGALGGPRKGLTDGYVRKYDAAGNLVWSLQVGTPSHDQLFDVAADATGVYVTGATQGQIGGPNAGSSDFFMSKFDLTGSPLWSVQVGSPAADLSFALALGADRAVIGGAANGPLAGPYAGGGDAAIVAFDLPGDAPGNVPLPSAVWAATATLPLFYVARRRLARGAAKGKPS
jgi:hypothetical protein